MEYQNVRRYIAQAVALNIPPPGYDLPAPTLDELNPRAFVPQNDEVHENMAPVIAGVAMDNQNPPTVEAADIPIAWDLSLAWREYCIKISRPFMNYFNEKVMEHNCMPLWKAASLADPLNMQRVTTTPRYLREITQPLDKKLVTPALIDRMISELSEYEKACSSLDWMNDTYDIRLKKVEVF